MAFIFKKAEENTNGHSAIASVVPQWFTLPHQINATLPNIVADDVAYVIMRAVQFFLPGEPQIYYVGLFNGMDDVELFNKTGQGRDVNRHNYTPEEIEVALQQPVTQAILGLARLRKLPVFEGDYTWAVTGGDELRIDWVNGTDSLSLEFSTKVGAPSFVVSVSDAAGSRSYNSIEELGSAR
jgi:sucrose phosphorylase